MIMLSAWVGCCCLSFWSVNVINSGKEFLSGLFVDVGAQANVDQVGQLLHGVFLLKHNAQLESINIFLSGEGLHLQARVKNCVRITCVFKIELV